MQLATIEKGAQNVSQPLPSQNDKQGEAVAAAEANQSSHNTRTILFMVILSFICALILSVLASALAEPKEIAKDLDRSKQMMIAAKILNHQGNFLIKDPSGRFVPAKYLKDGILAPGAFEDIATRAQLLEMYKLRLVPMLVDSKGELTTFQAQNIDEDSYLTSYKKSGYYLQPYKLIYKILANPSEEKAIKGGKETVEGYVIPVNGFGLWDAIYGYLAVDLDGNTIIGATWYDQKETPGLGASIAEAYWQDLFPGKVLFQESADGKTDFKSAPLGITVVKGKVAEVLGNAPKSKSAVDGMAGATLTGNGVTDAYRQVLNAYRPFLIKLQDASQKQKPEEEKKAAP
jgi:Na+-transporting NADH:ubiquinone oxidoreductase subunit C